MDDITPLQLLTQKLEVKKDPHSAGTEADILAQTEVLLEIHRNMDTVADMINRIEWIRRQIYDLKEMLQEKEGAKAVIEAVNALDEKLIDIEV